MTTGLRGSSLTADMPNTVWYDLLEAARDVGWQPMGTEKSSGWVVVDKDGNEIPGEVSQMNWPEDTPWPGIYDSNDCQVVTATDALALADALERASTGNDVMASWAKDVIAVCRAGSFMIV